MKASEIRNLSAADLQKKVSDLNQELFTLKFQLHTGHLENSSRINDVRRYIARVNTILQEKQG
ncbi:MAG: 50S ribosomal protein L29 [Desulfuromonadales bacterium]|nr:50S ribosomal protein L29 [Desulfuromonadales bacterium]